MILLNSRQKYHDILHQLDTKKTRRLAGLFNIFY